MTFAKIFVAILVVSAVSANEQTLDNFELGDFVTVRKNEFTPSQVEARGNSIEDNIENYVKSHDVTFNVPVLGPVTVDARKLDNDEVDFKLKLGGSGVEARKSKLKKIVGPILLVVLLKAITLIPLALGILGIKTWNALQLSFVSFVIAIAMGVYQMCKKIVGDNVAPHIIAHDTHYARSFEDAAEAMKMAYSAYAQN